MNGLASALAVEENSEVNSSLPYPALGLSSSSHLDSLGTDSYYLSCIIIIGVHGQVFFYILTKNWTGLHHINDKHVLNIIIINGLVDIINELVLDNINLLGLYMYIISEIVSSCQLNRCLVHTLH